MGKSLVTLGLQNRPVKCNWTRRVLGGSELFVAALRPMGSRAVYSKTFRPLPFHLAASVALGHAIDDWAGACSVKDFQQQNLAGVAISPQSSMHVLREHETVPLL